MNAPSSPYISVIIPTCHRDNLLAKCLDCLAPGRQTLPVEQYEVIVTDDGSRSTAQELVESSYPWARWIEGPRQGPAANRNNGADHAAGEFVAFTDDDCLPSREWLFSYAAAITPNIHVYEGKTTCAAGITSPLYQAPINLTGGCLWSCNFIIHADLFRKLGGFDTQFVMPAMEDVDLHERLCSRGEPILFVGAAAVDHPPRLINSGWRTGKMYEAKVQYWNKRGQYRHSFVAYLKHIKHQLHSIRRFGCHRDILLAGYALLIEAFYVMPRLPLWEKKYHHRYHA